jgi:signal transduction histidine kinase
LSPMAPDAEVVRLRRALRDLVALSTIPAAWVGRAPGAIAAGLADVLVELLDLDFVFVRLRDPEGGTSVEATLGNAWKAFPEWLEQRLCATGSLSHREIIPDVGAGRQPCRGVIIPVGVDGEGGLVAAACERADFPDHPDQLLLSIASNHAAMASQSARLIHERRRAEEALRQSNEQLAKASRLKSQFLARMSHELRTPMNAIIGFSDLLAEEAEGPLRESYMDYVQHIREGATHLLSLINDVLDLSKIEAGRLELFCTDINVDDQLAEVLSVIQSLPGASKLLFASHVPKKLCVYADRTRCKQIFYNLLSNAVKFTPEGGTISIEAVGQSACVAIAVADTGVGIPAEEQGAIFNEFHQVSATTRGVKEGTGLGLAITKLLVELHSGGIRVESEPGKGSRFTVTLPSGCGQTNKAPGFGGVRENAGRRKKILEALPSE